MNLENKNIDLFNPFIIVLMVILFLVLAMPMWYVYARLPAPGLDLFIYIGLGLLFFIIGILSSNLIFNKKASNDETISDEGQDSKSFSIMNIIKDNIPLSFDRNPSKLSIRDPYSRLETVLVLIVSFGILLQIVNILHLGGIPLFDANLKARAASKIWILSYIIFLPFINILLALFNRDSHYLLVFLGLLLFASTGYRTTPIAIALSIFITLYYTRNIKIKHQIMMGIIILVLLLAIGFIAVQAISWQHWTLNPIELISYRAAFTLNVLGHAIDNQLSTGGNLFYSTLTGYFTHVDPRNLVGIATLGRDHSITSTIFGPALLDFGWVGMIVQMLILGFLLKSLHSIQKCRKEIYTAFYGILLAQTIIWIETGPTDIVIWLFFIVGILLVIKSFMDLSKD